MNSKQGARYIKKRMGNELKNKILEYNGILIEQLPKQRSTISICPKCNFTNILENKYCTSCSYLLSPEAYDEIKQNEEKRFIELKRKYTNKITTIENQMYVLLKKVDILNLD